MSFPPDACALCAAVSGATNKSVSCRTPADCRPPGASTYQSSHIYGDPPERALRTPADLRICPGHAVRTETGW